MDDYKLKVVRHHKELQVLKLQCGHAPIQIGTLLVCGDIPCFNPDRHSTNWTAQIMREIAGLLEEQENGSQAPR